MVAGLAITAVTLIVFGVVLALAGRSGERGYWTQRDTSETPGQDDVSLAQVNRQVWSYATTGKRPSLRLMAIGLLMVYAGIVFGVLAVIAALLSR